MPYLPSATRNSEEPMPQMHQSSRWRFVERPVEGDSGVCKLIDAVVRNRARQSTPPACNGHSHGAWEVPRIAMPSSES